MSSVLSRAFALLIPLALASCGGDDPAVAIGDVDGGGDVVDRTFLVDGVP